jgi:cell division septation protein DedD
MEKKTVLRLITVVAIIAVVIFAGCIDEKEVEELAPTFTPSPTLTPEPVPTVTPTPMLTETPTPAITISAPKPEEDDVKAPEEMTGTGTFVLHVTDQPSAIGDFDILNVSVSEVMHLI